MLSERTAAKKHPHSFVWMFSVFLVFAALVGENLVKGEGYAPYSADDDENAKHSNAHISEIVNEVHRIYIHYSYSFLTNMKVLCGFRKEIRINDAKATKLYV